MDKVCTSGRRPSFRVLAVACSAFTACSPTTSMTNRVGSHAIRLYQIQPVAKRQDSSKQAPGGTSIPIDLDAYAFLPCPADDAKKNKDLGGKPTAPATAPVATQSAPAAAAPPPDASNRSPGCTDPPALVQAIQDPTGAMRNRLRSVLLTRSDLICSETEAQIVGTNDLLNFSLGQITTLLAGAGAIVTGATAAKILSGTAAMTNATRSNVNEVFYQNALKSAIIQKIGDSRKTQKALMDSRSFMPDWSPKTLSVYSTEEMLGDVIQYHNLCSFYQGVTSLSQSTAGAGPTTAPPPPPVAPPAVVQPPPAAQPPAPVAPPGR